MNLSYITQPVNSVIAQLLQWWKRNSPKFPRLAYLAKKVSAIGTNGTSESVLSKANQTITDLRISLNTEICLYIINEARILTYRIDYNFHF